MQLLYREKRLYTGVRRLKGAEAERLAETFLQDQNLVLLQRNYRCRLGEIDLIMRDSETIVFVEVRMRGSRNYGGAAESITSTKQQKLIQTAKHYLLILNREPPCRFDAVLLSDLSDRNGIEWIRDAFTL